jgi:hypothetical protein
MQNCMMGFPNRIDASTLSSGSWRAALPLANLKTRPLSEVSRSTDATAASTKFDIDLGSSLRVQLVSLVNHNFSLSATWRLRGADVSDFSVLNYDSGASGNAVWSSVHPTLSLDWEASNWWTGQYTSEEITGYTAAATHILASKVFARYWRIEIFDTANAAGYVQLGRVFIGQAWQPPVNMLRGSSIGWSTDTQVQKARSGTKYFSRRTPYRTTRFTLDWLSQDEAFSGAFELQRRAGIDQEIMWIQNPDDTLEALRRQYLGTLQQLNPLIYSNPEDHATAFEIEEVI